jgi:hypothetical protein
MKHVLWILLAALAGCGYTAGRLYAYDNLAVPIFQNDSARRINEFDLTDAVVRELQSSGVTVNPASPRHRLEGRITAIEQPRLAEDRDSNVIVGSFSVVVEIRVVDPADGRELVKWINRRFAASFAVGRGQTLETARAQVFDQVAKWVMEQLEEKW